MLPEIAIPRGLRLRPVEALQTWLAAGRDQHWPGVPSGAEGRATQDARLSNLGVARIVKRYAECSGLDPSAYAGHSLRSGFLTSAAEAGASVLKTVEVSVDVLRVSGD